MLTTRVAMPSVFAPIFAGVACEPHNAETLKELLPFTVWVDEVPQPSNGGPLFDKPFYVVARDPVHAVIWTYHEVIQQNPEWRGQKVFVMKIRRLDIVLANSESRKPGEPGFVPEHGFEVTPSGAVIALEPEG